MARPTRQGVDYFPFDVHLDNKFKFIEIKFGLEGFGAVLKMMQQIYSQGYWTEWNEDEILLFSAGNNIQPEIVEKITQECLTRDIFDKTLYEKYSILTSSGIQKRYKEIVKRRKSVEVVTEYLLIGDGFGVTSEVKSTSRKRDVDIVHTPSEHDADRSTQSKVKESKVKESKRQQTTKEEEKIPKEKPVVVVDEDFAELVNFYSDNIGPLNHAIDETLNEMCDLLNAKLALVALRESVLANATNKIKYTFTILRNWKSQNFETVSDVEQSESRRINAKQNHGGKVASLFDASPETLARQQREIEKYKDVVIDDSDLPF